MVFPNLKPSRLIPLEYYRPPQDLPPGLGERVNLLQIGLLLLIVQPGDLETGVALLQPAHRVVEGVSRAREKSRRRVVLAEDHAGIGFAALERDPYSHLV